MTTGVFYGKEEIYMPVIDEIKEQHAKVREKGLKYRLSYFWEYYKVHTIAIIVGGIFLFSIIKSIVTYKDTMFEAVMINAVNKPDETAFAEILELDTKKETVLFDNGFYMSEDTERYDQQTYANEQKLMAVIAARTADVFLAPEVLSQKYWDSGVFGDLRDYFDEETLEALGDKVVWYEPTDPDTGEKQPSMPIVIEVTDAPGLKGCLVYDKVYMSAIVNTKHTDYVSRFYNFLYSSESSSTE